MQNNPVDKHWAIMAAATVIKIVYLQSNWNYSIELSYNGNSLTFLIPVDLHPNCLKHPRKILCLIVSLCQNKQVRLWLLIVLWCGATWFQIQTPSHAMNMQNILHPYRVHVNCKNFSYMNTGIATMYFTMTKPSDIGLLNWREKNSLRWRSPSSLN